MKREALKFLRCPRCAAELTFRDEETITGEAPVAEIESGDLECRQCARTFPIRNAVPRFGPLNNYTSSFGLQWHHFRQTQLDSHTRLPLSRARFFSETTWTTTDLNGALVLDAGCGAGRFAEVALEHGATVVAVDYSEAVDACWANLGPHPRLHVVQADIYQLPFAPGTFDLVYSMGVLQHTPDAETAFKSLVPQLKIDGRIVVDVYAARPLNLLWPKYWLRPVTRRMSPARLFRLVHRTVPWMLPVSLAIGRIPWVGGRLRYAVPVANYDGKLPLSAEQIREWALLDTFDMFAPEHDHPQSIRTVRRWFEEARLSGIDVQRASFVVGRGRKT